jgi:hypothetical protein
MSVRKRLTFFESKMVAPNLLLLRDFELEDGSLALEEGDLVRYVAKEKEKNVRVELLSGSSILSKKRTSRRSKKSETYVLPADILQELPDKDGKLQWVLRRKNSQRSHARLTMSARYAAADDNGDNGDAVKSKSKSTGAIGASSSSAVEEDENGDIVDVKHKDKECKVESSGGGVSSPLALNGKDKGKGKSKAKKRGKKDKDKDGKHVAVVTGPTGVQHVGHLGITATGFEAKNLPPQLAEVFQNINKMLKDLGLKGITRSEAVWLLKAATAHLTGPAAAASTTTTPAATPTATPIKATGGVARATASSSVAEPETPRVPVEKSTIAPPAVEDAPVASSRSKRNLSGSVAASVIGDLETQMEAQRARFKEELNTRDLMLQGVKKMLVDEKAKSREMEAELDAVRRKLAKTERQHEKHIGMLADEKRQLESKLKKEREENAALVEEMAMMRKQGADDLAKSAGDDDDDDDDGGTKRRRHRSSKSASKGKDGGGDDDDAIGKGDDPAMLRRKLALETKRRRAVQRRFNRLQKDLEEMEAAASRARDELRSNMQASLHDSDEDSALHREKLELQKRIDELGDERAQLERELQLRIGSLEAELQDARQKNSRLATHLLRTSDESADETSSDDNSSDNGDAPPPPAPPPVVADVRPASKATALDLQAGAKALRPAKVAEEAPLSPISASSDLLSAIKRGKTLRHVDADELQRAQSKIDDTSLLGTLTRALLSRRAEMLEDEGDDEFFRDDDDDWKE